MIPAGGPLIPPVIHPCPGRPYRPGDPVRDLHILTWARTGKPHVLEYQQEYFTRIGVVIDNDRAVCSEEGFEAAISLAAGVVAKLTSGEALIDLLVLGGQVHAFTIGRALGTLDQALDLLACADLGDTLDTPQLMRRLEPYLARLSCIVLIAFSPVVSGKAAVAGKSPSMFTDPSIDFHWFPLDNPGLVTIPLSFLLAVIGTLTSREKPDETRWAEMEVRSLTGHGAEKAVGH